MSVVFEIPWAALVSANKRLRPGGRRMVNTDAYNTSLHAIRLFGLKARGAVKEPIEGEWECILRFYEPDARRRDVDNYVKPILDALEGVFWTDDRWVTGLAILKMSRNDPDPRVVIAVKPWSLGETLLGLRLDVPRANDSGNEEGG